MELLEKVPSKEARPRPGFKSRRSHKVAGLYVPSPLVYKGRDPDKIIVKDYLHDGGYRLDYALRKVEEMPEPNRSYLIDYKRHMELQDRKERTMARRLHELRYSLNLLGKDTKLATMKDIENLVLKINRSDMALASQAMTKLTLKNFIKYLHNFPGKHKYPEIVDWIEIKRPKNSKKAEDLLTREEMITLIGACKTPRDKVVISILSTFGCRVGELLNLKYKDVEMTDQDVSWIGFDGKTGYRRCPFTPQSLCHPYLIEYLNQYKPGSPEAPLFKTKDGLALDYKNVRRLLQHLKEWTGLKKRLHPHIFRFSAATEWSGIIPESLLKSYMGWTQGSKMAGVYIKQNDKLLAEGIMRATGASVKAETKMPSATKECAKCHKVEPITNTYCSNCGSNLDKESVLKATLDIVTTRSDMANMQKELLELRKDFKFVVEALQASTTKNSRPPLNK